jgi:hypothetical protein
MTSFMGKRGSNICDDAGVHVVFVRFMAAYTTGFFLSTDMEGSLAPVFFVFYLVQVSAVALV